MLVRSRPSPDPSHAPMCRFSAGRRTCTVSGQWRPAGGSAHGERGHLGLTLAPERPPAAGPVRAIARFSAGLPVKALAHTPPHTRPAFSAFPFRGCFPTLLFPVPRCVHFEGAACCDQLILLNIAFLLGGDFPKGVRGPQRRPGSPRLSVQYFDFILNKSAPTFYRSRDPAAWVTLACDNNQFLKWRERLQTR